MNLNRHDRKRLKHLNDYDTNSNHQKRKQERKNEEILNANGARQDRKRPLLLINNDI